MTKVSKSTKIVVSLVLLVLAFLCSVNATTSYFTATSNKSGALEFPLLDVRFTTRLEDDSIPSNQQGEVASTITLYPQGEMSRGGTFGLSISDANNAPSIKDIEIKNMAGSCEVYVRFWIDAYTYTNDVKGETNYGKYFLLQGENIDIIRGGVGGHATEADWCYFVPYSLYAQESCPIGNAIRISDELPDSVLGQQLKITMTVQAVQAINGAFLEEFNKVGDLKGYCSVWKV